MLNERNDDIERMIEQRRQQITDLENELIHLDDLLISSKSLICQLVSRDDGLFS